MPKNASKTNPYEQFSRHNLILRDQLAIDRTVMANERTLLAFCRTGLALAITGAGSIQLIPGMAVLVFSSVLILGGFAVIIEGFRRYFIMRKIISFAGTQNGTSSCSASENV